MARWPLFGAFVLKSYQLFFPFFAFSPLRSFPNGRRLQELGLDYFRFKSFRFCFRYTLLYTAALQPTRRKGYDCVLSCYVQFLCVCVLPVDSSVHRMPDPRATKRSTSQRNLPESVYRLHRSGYNLSGTPRFGSFSAALMVDAKWGERENGERKIRTTG